MVKDRRGASCAQYSEAVAEQAMSARVVMRVLKSNAAARKFEGRDALSSELGYGRRFW